MILNRIFVATGLSIVLVSMPACRESGSAAQAGTDESTPAWILASSPDDVQSVVDAKDSAQEGDIIVLRGRIGGRKNPLSDGSPVFTLMDLSLPYCGQVAEDSCSTPWDYCCEPPEIIAANSATIQIVDENNQPVSTSLLAAGLGPLDEVVVVGRAGPRPNGIVLAIRSAGVYIVQDESPDGRPESE
ncbi:MAG: hypothetical protein ACYTF7_02875 [Planctomycetota bacterium]|jgi:hypothetical protein